MSTSQNNTNKISRRKALFLVAGVPLAVSLASVLALPTTPVRQIDSPVFAQFLNQVAALVAYRDYILTANPIDATELVRLEFSAHDASYDLYDTVMPSKQWEQEITLPLVGNDWEVYRAALAANECALDDSRQPDTEPDETAPQDAALYIAAIMAKVHEFALEAEVQL